MLLFVIVLALAVASVFGAHILEESTTFYLVSAFTAVLSIAIAVIMLFAIIFENISLNGHFEAYQQRYEGLVYQAKNHLYDNENDYGKKDLVDDILDWNEDLAKRRSFSRSIWIGAFYPGNYEKFDYIPMDLIQ